jgi:hypothetical protein
MPRLRRREGPAQVSRRHRCAIINRGWALRLAEAGIPTFPCGPDKKPLVRWRTESSCDATTVAGWWSQFPNALPAIDLGKADLVVLDGDRHGGPDGRAALRNLLQQQAGFNLRSTPSVLTPGDGVHVYFKQNGHALTNSRGELPDGIDVRGIGGFVVAYAVLPDNRQYKAAPSAPDLISAYQAGTIPHVPQGIVDLIRARKIPADQSAPEQPRAAHSGSAGTADIRETSWAEAALAGCVTELAECAAGGRNETLNSKAYRLGRMVARGWLDRAQVESTLIGAMQANGYLGEEGIKRVQETLKNGLDAGMGEPHPDLAERDNQTQPRNADSDKRTDSAADEQQGPKTKRADPAVINAEELNRMRFDPIKFVVPGYFVEGLTLFAGKPKIGKSWLLLHAASAVADGNYTLGGVYCEQGDVLYAALEDNPRRLQSRMTKLFGTATWPTRLSFTCEMPRLAEGGLTFIRNWIEGADRPRLVIIDTLAMVRMPNRKDQNSYDADYAAVRELRDLALTCGVAVMLVHHLRKAEADDPFDTISGTLGLTGAPDTIMVIRRDTSGTMLHARGRDLIEIEKAIKFDAATCIWSIVGDADVVRQSAERAVIVKVLDEAGEEPLGPRQIAEACGMKAINVRRLLSTMKKDGVVKNAGAYGKYVLVRSHNHTSDHTDHTSDHTTN